MLTNCKSNKTEENATKVEQPVFNPDAITWNPDIASALAQAKASGKLLFVECYSPTCPICQSIEPYFSTKEVASKYNTDFISYKLDVGVAEQVKFLNDRNIWLPSFPQFLFFDGDGNLVHQEEPSASTESILKVAENAKSVDNKSGSYKARFEKGERDMDFLIKYGVYTRLIKDTLSNYKVADALYEIFPKNDIGTKNGYLAMQKTVSNIDNGFFKYWINHVPEADAFEKAAGHGEGQGKNTLGGIIQASIFSKEGKKYDTKKLNLIKGYMTKVGAGEYTNTYLWEYETLANIREGNPNAALNIGKNMAKAFSNNGPSLVYIVKVFNDNFPDKSYLSSANEWLKAALPQLKEINHLAEYYFELARTNLKNGDAAAAKSNLNEAIKNAKAAEMDLGKFETLQKQL